MVSEDPGFGICHGVRGFAKLAFALVSPQPSDAIDVQRDDERIAIPISPVTLALGTGCGVVPHGLVGLGLKGMVFDRLRVGVVEACEPIGLRIIEHRRNVILVWLPASGDLVIP